MHHFRSIVLDNDHHLWLGRLPPDICWTAEDFDRFWATHPHTFHRVFIFGKWRNVPRWSQIYNRSYIFSGAEQIAVETPVELTPLIAWSQTVIDARINGILVNWYDGALGHKIGAHRDDENDLIVDAPIVTIISGENRNFRLRRWKT